MSQRHRSYCEADLAFFAQYANERLFAKPDYCTSGDKCWVLHGPPCFSSDGVCRECCAMPKILWIDAKGRGRFPKQRKLRQ
jgi:hypothetical protein